MYPDALCPKCGSWLDHDAPAELWWCDAHGWFDESEVYGIPEKPANTGLQADGDKTCPVCGTWILIWKDGCNECGHIPAAKA
jgi:hypothetical protein